MLDLGILKPGEIADASFLLENTGWRDVVIDSVHTDCGCITASFSPMVLAPGQAASLPVQMVSKDPKEHFRHRVVVRSNCKEKPNLILFVKGCSAIER